MSRFIAATALGLLGAVAGSWIAFPPASASGATAAVVAVTSPAPIDWPNGAAMHAADTGAPLGQNISGLAVDGAASLWAVRDSGALLHLERSGTGWKPTSGSSGERALHYPGGQGSPDSEAVTTVAGDDGAVYIAAERDSNASMVSRNSILRFEKSGSGVLNATREWRLDAIFGATPANTGVESLAWIPDAVFVSMGFHDRGGKVYSPADYLDHGGGLFASAVESRGEIVFLALRDDGTVREVGKAATGLDAIMDLFWSDTRQELWATCDIHCKGQAAVLRAEGGAFETIALVHPPTGMQDLNDEGFAIVPICTNGAMTAVWSDDSATGGNSLREAALPCDPLAGPASATASVVATSTVIPVSADISTTSPPAAATTVRSSAALSVAPATTSTPVTSSASIAPSSGSTRTVPYIVGGSAVIGAAAILVGWLRRRRPHRTMMP